MRVYATITSLAAAAIAPALRLYSYGGLEPFLFVSSGQAFFYMLMRLLTEFVESFTDIFTLFTSFGSAVYLTVITVAGATVLTLTSSPSAAIIMTICASACVRSSLQSTARVTKAMHAALLRPIQPAQQPTPAPPLTPPPKLTLSVAAMCIILVAAVPLMPCAFSCLLLALPSSLTTPITLAVLGLGLAPPRALVPLVRHVRSTLTGAALYPARVSQGAVRFDRATALGLLAVPLWGLVLLAQAGVLEQASSVPTAPNTYFVSQVWFVIALFQKPNLMFILLGLGFFPSSFCLWKW